ncbi:MAG: pyrroline-5-carboxylate reductase [Tannerella sp.]|jgi:pyrroline-5-carboxylate reductase|nr:pyrroline-5-carboxylate reductase [Tannerella sp.]
MKLTIIGAGNMGSAIARGLGSSRIIDSPEPEIYCTDILPEKLNKIKDANASIHVSTNNIEAIKDADIVIVAVKPWFIEATIDEIKEALDYKRQIFVSIAAGIEFDKLCRFLKKEGDELPAIFRIIPNTAIEVRESVNFVSAYNATQEQTDIIKNIFDELGLTIIIEERLIGAGMALASCGIAYAFRYIRAAVEGAVELGLSPELAKKIELQTLKGAVALLETNNNHPEAEIDKVTTPGGITIKGLNAMEEAGFTNAVIKGLKASV